MTAPRWPAWHRPQRFIRLPFKHRVRHSTVVLALLFVALVGLNIWVRPSKSRQVFVPYIPAPTTTVRAPTPRPPGTRTTPTSPPTTVPATIIVPSSPGGTVVVSTPTTAASTTTTSTGPPGSSSSTAPTTSTTAPG